MANYRSVYAKQWKKKVIKDIYKKEGFVAAAAKARALAKKETKGGKRSVHKSKKSKKSKKAGRPKKRRSSPYSRALKKNIKKYGISKKAHSETKKQLKKRKSRKSR